MSFIEEEIHRDGVSFFFYSSVCVFLSKPLLASLFISQQHGLWHAHAADFPGVGKRGPHLSRCCPAPLMLYKKTKLPKWGSTERHIAYFIQKKLIIFIKVFG